MGTVARRILTINAGSSSIKCAGFEVGDEPVMIFKGEIERIGQTDACLRVIAANDDDSGSHAIEARDHASAMAAMMAWIEDVGGSQPIVAIGHRIVHGGPGYSEPKLVDATVLAELKHLCAIDPEHMPEGLALVEGFRERYPQLPQLLCFDTAFHHALPRVACVLPIPRRYEAQGVRRYGFHGLSYAWLMQELSRRGDRGAQGRAILAHLGNGASLAAVHRGQPVDTSMGFTPAAGIPMGSRSGDLDPGLAGHLARMEGMSPVQFERMVNSQSGLLGISETSADMRDLLEREVDDVRAAEAVAVFCYQARKWIGAYAAALGGLDTLVFSAGIGERSAVVRERICGGLNFLGIALDPELNAANAPVISVAGARVIVRVIRTNEEMVIAQAVIRMLAQGDHSQE